MRRTLLYLLFLHILSPSLFSLNFYDDKPIDQLAAELTNAMTDEELLGQILMWGYSGSKPTEETLTWIRERHIAGVKVFGWNGRNLKQLAETMGRYQKEAAEYNRFSIPLLTATDQEGGRVRHITGNTTITPGTMSLGASGLPYDSYMTGFYIGQELRAVGVNMNFAPDIDLYNHPDGSVMRTRAFSADPVQTGVLGTSFFKGQQKAGVISTAKHFPGHGNTAIDSHGRLPVVKADLNSYRKVEAVPYDFMIREGVPAIMVGHINYPAITHDDSPASISKLLITDILKEELGFKGIVITDDMVMYGVRRAGGGIPHLCLNSVKAGTDLLLVSRAERNHQQIWDLLLSEMKNDPRFYARVKDGAFRVLRVKLEYLKGELRVPLEPDPEKVNELIPVPGSKEFFFSQACRSTSYIKKGRLPITKENQGRVLLVGSYKTFLKKGKERFPKAHTLRYDYEPVGKTRQDAIQRIVKAAPSYDTIIFCLSDDTEIAMVNALKNYSGKVVILSVSTPIYAKKLPWIQSGVAVYGTIESCFEAGFAAIRGDFEPRGKIPFPMTSESKE